MGSTIALFIFFGSVVGIGTIVWRKLPLLLEVDTGEQDTGFGNLIFQSTRKFRDSDKVKATSEKVLHKTLSKTRVIAMKTESKTGAWLEGLRKRSEQRKQKFSEAYWDQFKKRGGKQ